MDGTSEKKKEDEADKNNSEQRRNIGAGEASIDFANPEQWTFRQHDNPNMQEFSSNNPNLTANPNIKRSKRQRKKEQKKRKRERKAKLKAEELAQNTGTAAYGETQFQTENQHPGELSTTYQSGYSIDEKGHVGIDRWENEESKASSSPMEVEVSTTYQSGYSIDDGGHVDIGQGGNAESITSSSPMEFKVSDPGKAQETTAHSTGKPAGVFGWVKGKLFGSAKPTEGTTRPKFCFNVYVQESASGVQITFLKGNHEAETFLMYAEDRSGLYWMLPVDQVPKHLASCPFYYQLRNQHGIFSNAAHLKDYHSRRKDNRSSYTVFCFDKHFNDFFTGPFHFAQQIFQDFCEKKLTLKQALQEYDEVRFGRTNMSQDQRMNVAHWVRYELENKSTCENAIFFSHVIEEFDRRILYNLPNNYPLLKDCIGDQAKQRLLQLLSQCDRKTINNIGENISRDVKKIVAFILSNLRGKALIENLVNFSCNYGVDILSEVDKAIKMLHGNESLAPEVLHDVCAPLSTLKSENERNRLLSFMVSRSPSISFLWTFYDYAHKAFPSYLPGAKKLQENFKKILSSPHYNTRAEVLDVRSWRSVPEMFRQELAKTFMSALQETLKHVGRDLETLEVNAIETFFTDEALMTQGEGLRAFLEFSKIPQLSKVAIKVLQLPGFAKYWVDLPDKDKTEFYQNVLKSFLSSSNKAEGAEKKGHVLRMLEAMNDTYLSLKICPCENMKQIVKEKCEAFLATEGVLNIAQPFSEITELQEEVVQYYYMKLKSTIKRDIENTQRHGDILKLLEGLSNTDVIQKKKTTWVTGTVFLSLLERTKGLNTSTFDQHEFPEVFEEMFVNESLWSAVFRAWPEGHDFELCPQVEALTVAIKVFKKSLDDETIKIKDLRRLQHNPRNVELLQLIHASLVDGEALKHKGQQQIVELVFSCSKGEEESYEILEKVVDALSFLKKIAKDIVVMKDMDGVLGDLTAKKITFKDTSVCDVSDDDFWGPVAQYLDRILKMERRLKYKVFQNAAEASLRNKYSSRQLERERWMHYGLQVEDPYITDVLRVVSSGGVTYLKDKCSYLVKNAGEMPIIKAEQVLRGVTEDKLKNELKFLQRIFKEEQITFDAEILLERFLKFPKMFENAKVLKKLLDSRRQPPLAEIEDFCKNPKDQYDNLIELHQATEKVAFRIDHLFQGNYGEVIKEISESEELIKLLEETANDDVSNLIDAVEEHSDSTVAAKEVSDFIEIHRVLAPVLKADKFLNVLQNRLHKLTDDQATELAARIKCSSQNAYSLRNVYKNIANRGEMTKEVVLEAVSNGKYEIRSKQKDDSDEDILLSEELWEYSVSYPNKKTESLIEHDIEKLQDLKSRVLLIVNSERKQSSDVDEHATFELFIKQVDLLNEIVATGEELQRSGHPEYQNYSHECKTLEETHEICTKLKQELVMWENTMKDARRSNVYLNFFHAKQLWVLKEFLNKSTSRSVTEEVLSLLRFVDKSVTSEQVKTLQDTNSLIPEASYEWQLKLIGTFLEGFFSRIQSRRKSLQVDSERGLVVAVLDQGSKKTTSVVMKLFEHSKSPQPHKIMFCDGSSTWYEIELFLWRCFTDSQKSNSPYCLANVDVLSTDLQLQLIDSIGEFQRSSTPNYWLVLICRGGENHHIVSQFRECVKEIPVMDENELQSTFARSFPNVETVTSDLPGLGKTETIYRRAAEERKRIVCFSINGPVSREKLVHRLSNLGLDEECLLHIDISEVEDPLLVDNFLFELIVFGMASSGTKLYHVPTYHIAIEIANTLEHRLKDALTTTKCYPNIHVKWQDFKNFVCSQEKESAVQVVCHYLDAYSKQNLEDDKLSLKDLKQAVPLTETKCRELIKRYFNPKGDLSFDVVHCFLNVLATQLRKFSASPFFRPETLKHALKDASNVRIRLFEALKDVSIDFATRSVRACKEEQQMALFEKLRWSLIPSSNQQLSSSIQQKDVANKMIDRVKGMVTWTEQNHLVVMFQEAHSVSALFRELDKVPEQVKKLFQSQDDPLKDLGGLGERELKGKLKKILFADTRNQSQDFDSHSYVLTPDNILKMVLIIQRIRAGVPVIVMGETGCGKTSLVRYLASSCGVPIKVLNFHAGIYEKDIVEFTKDQIGEAQKDLQKQVWVFFDEINTCDYLGLINDIICHRTLNGKELPPNLVFIAACNPYCLRPTDSIVTAGLTGKSVTDEYSNLVYRVKPLPETMMDYVWDYGSLDPKDERAYIERMVDKLERDDSRLIVDLLATSQEFIRHVQKSRYCVSLRDVRRCILLAKWFAKMINHRPDLDVSKLTTKSEEIYSKAQRFDVEDRSIILALAHSYQCRIPLSEERKAYRLKLERIFQKHGRNFSAADLDLVIRAEQEEYLARMELPDGTARNTALRENVFVILVCILNRIPVFVVGKPGCSKSLSMQVIRSNLRGKDSKDGFFKTLPRLLFLSYQGSESSTSEGILKVFEKAEKYKEHNKQDESIPVVLLDEVGLAEISKYNPLKVLHRLLEPEDQEFPNVAVVGISNWALDAAKMNRAIHLSRPEPTYEDLKETGMTILEAQLDKFEDQASREAAAQDVSQEMLSCLAKSYFEYQKVQTLKNFHGLRDYYSLVKCMSRALVTASDDTSVQTSKNFSTFRALQRNFGGLLSKDKTIEDIYCEKSKSLQSHGISETREEFPVTDLISDNLEDPNARHLMLITRGDSALSIIDQILSDLNREKVIIYGSKFEEDISEDYSYRILSRIILHMERDCVLVLRDLESVYGSLYDMLNQNYVVVGKKKNCRVALGPYSNPMCQVHDGFRCIVLIDEDKVNKADPPFLNRFEKQLLRYSDVLSESEHNVIKKLQCWTKDFCSIETTDFNERDVFLGLHDDTLASLVLLLRDENSPKSDHGLFEMCKDELISIATPDGVLRCLRSKLYKDDALDVKSLYESFFNKPLHRGLKGFIESVLDTSRQIHPTQNMLDHPSMSFKYFVMTHSSIHTDVVACLKGSLSCQVEKLGAFKSEKHLSKKIQTFWSSSDKELLVFQCKPHLDGEHMTLMKSMIEQHHERYLRLCQEENKLPTKSICIIVHLERGRETSSSSQPWQFNFMRGWKQATLDSLEQPKVPIDLLLGDSVFKLFENETLSLKDIIENKLLWCFTRLKYPESLSDPENVNEEVSSLRSSEAMMKYLHDIVLQWIEKHHDKVEGAEYWSSKLRACDWQINVSCDKKALFGSLTLSGAIRRYVDDLVRRPLAKAIYLIANRLTFKSCHRALTESRERTENEVFMAGLIKDDKLFDIDEIPDPQESGCYVLTQAECVLEFPFSIIFCEKIGSLKEKYLKKWRDGQRRITNESEEEFLQELSLEIKEAVPQLFYYDWPNNGISLYIEDIFDFMSSQNSSALTRDQRVAIMKASCAQHVVSTPVQDLSLFLARIHFFLWRYEPDFLAIQQLYSLILTIPGQDLEKLSSPYFDVFEKCVSLMKKKNGIGGSEERRGEQDDDDDDDDDDGDDDEDEDLEEEEEDSDDEDYDDDDDDDDDDEEDDDDEDKALCQKEIAAFRQRKPFFRMMFDTICEAIIPTQELIQDLGSPQEWLTTANTFVAHAAKSNFGKTRLFSNLRVCCDYGNMILSPNNFENPYSLYMLGELCHGEEGSKDLHNSFDRVLDSIDSTGSPTRMVNEFRINFLSRCLESCETEEFYQSILNAVSSFSEKESLELASPIMSRIIFYASHFRRENPFLAILKDPEDVSIHHPFFKSLETILNNIVEMNEGIHDCHFAVIILDVIDNITWQDFDFLESSEVSFSSSHTMTCLKAAINTVEHSRRSQNSLALLTAVSYIRNAFSSIAELIYRQPFLLKRDSEHSHLFMFLSSFLEAPKGSSTKSPRKASCMLYFLRELRKNLSLHELRKLCEEANMLPALQTLTWSDEMSKFPITILDDALLIKLEFSNALIKLKHLGDASPMEDICSELAVNAKKRKAFAGVLTEQLFLSQSFQSQTDTVDKAMDSIIEVLPQELSPQFKKLILCLTGKEDFHGKALRISPEMSLSAVRKATIVLHLLRILTAECTRVSYTVDRPFLSYLLDPTKASEGYLLANPDGFNQRPSESWYVLTCPCGTAFLRQVGQTTCPHCLKPCALSAFGIEPQQEKRARETAISLCISSIAEDNFSVLNMTPSSYRFLHLLVVSTLYAGFSLGTFSSRKLSQFFSLDEEKDSPVDKCLEEMNTDLKVLERLWGCNEEQVIATVHQLINDTSDLITKRVGSPHLRYLGKEQREELQKAFTEKVNRFFQNRKQDPKNGGTMDSSSLEAQIDERDSTGGFDVQTRNLWLPRLFRFTKQKSLDDLRVSYYNASDSVKTKHPLLGLFLQYMRILPKVGHLYPLIKFSNMLEKHFGRRLRRKDAAAQAVGAVVDTNLHMDLKKAMEQFITSWGSVRSVVEKEVGAAPKISKTSSVSHFLMDPDSDGKYLYEAVLALQRIQNEFQGKVLKLALEVSCPALDFLRKSDSSGCSSSVPIVHVQDVKRSELICFEWDDKMLLHSYHDTEYGKGQEIHYDFGKIESELAERFLTGKVYLSTDGGLRQFPYSNELFHTCANVLNDISERLPQKPLTTDQQNRLSALKEEELKNARALLDELEVILYFLSKASYVDSMEMALEDYVAKKLQGSNLLKKELFGTTLKDIKVCHVVNMYQKLEELLADVAIEAVHDKYRAQISMKALQGLEGSRSNKKESEVPVIVTTLRRFIFRYLLSDQDRQDTWDPQENAVEYLSDPSLWSIPDVISWSGAVDEDLEPKSALEDLTDKFIPRSTKICEVYSVMSFYDKAIKEAKEKSQKQMAPSQKANKGRLKKFKVSSFA